MTPLPHTKHLIGGSFHVGDMARHTSHEWQILVIAVCAVCALIVVIDIIHERRGQR